MVGNNTLNYTVTGNDMFGSPIVVKFCELDLFKLKEYACALKAESPGVEHSNYGGWQSNNLVQCNNIHISELIYKIQEGTNEMREIYRIKKGLRFGLQNMWININKPHDFNIEHEHPGAMFSGVFYVKTQDKCGSITFVHPNRVIDIYFPPDSMEEITPNNANTWTIPPEDNKLILFASHMRHWVTPNESNEDRISIAFNVGFL